MKQIHALYIIVISLLWLGIGTACEEDYRDITFFTGAEPVYQSGTCGNLITEADLYLTSPDGLVVGLYGGDGTYIVSGGDTAVAVIELTEVANGYQRMLVTPQGEGVTEFVVEDSSGTASMLRVRVHKCLKLAFFVFECGYHYDGSAISDEDWADVQHYIEELLPVKPGTRYVLDADGENNSLLSDGCLTVYPSDGSDPLEGSYKRLEGGENNGLLFSYGDEEHVFTARSPLEIMESRNSVLPSFIVWEDVTHLSPLALPEEGRVYRAEFWGQTEAID